jgi:predicted dehydrogenase
MPSIETGEGGAPCPADIAIIGGGRWARVLVDVLCGLIPPSVRVSVHSARGVAAMGEWARGRGLSPRLTVSAEWPDAGALAGGAVIVANAARDHERAVEWALSNDIHTLVEKPIALSGSAADRLANSPGHHDRLAAAQVFLYARYVENFCAMVAAAGPVVALDIDWADPGQEERYGESKQYDAGLPIFSDWLPHLVPIVGALLREVPSSCRAVRFSRGGAQCDLELVTGNVRCLASLERGASGRRRIVRARTAGATYQLDFSTEPGSISSNYGTAVADPDWHAKPRPLARMLAAFLAWAGGAAKDDRLDTAMGRQACHFSDQVGAQYRLETLAMLAARLTAPEPVDEDLRYALAEALQADGRLPAAELERCIRNLKHRFTGADGPEWAHQLSTSGQPVVLLRRLAESDAA